MVGRREAGARLGHTVISVAVSDDDALFAAGAANKACVYSTVTGEACAKFMAKGPVTSVVFAGMGEERGCWRAPSLARSRCGMSPRRASRMRSSLAAK